MTDESGYTDELSHEDADRSVKNAAIDLRRRIELFRNVSGLTALQIDLTVAAVVDMRVSPLTRAELTNLWAAYDLWAGFSDSAGRRKEIEARLYAGLALGRLHTLEAAINDLRNALLVLGTIADPEFTKDDTECTRDAVAKIVSYTVANLSKLIRPDPPPIITDVQPVVLKQGDT